MQDELDARLLRRFALAAPPGRDEEFTAQVSERIAAVRRRRLSAQGLFGPSVARFTVAWHWQLQPCVSDTHA